MRLSHGFFLKQKFTLSRIQTKIVFVIYELLKVFPRMGNSGTTNRPSHAGDGPARSKPGYRFRRYPISANVY